MILKHFHRVVQTHLRRFCSINSAELTVRTFCDLYVNLPYHISLKPLCVHKYQNCDKLLIHLTGTDKELVKYTIDGNRINIFCDDNEEGDIVCNIKAPIKANMYIKSDKNIDLGHFQGDKIYLDSKNGTITVNKFHGDKLNVKTNNGNINLNGSIVATSVQAVVQETGNISTGKLQSLNVLLQGNTGNITVDSSYSGESNFVLKKGNLDVHNIHKHCKIKLDEGSLNMTGFDGKLVSEIGSGDADIQLSRIDEDSSIILQNLGNINLKLAENCQKAILLDIESNNVNIGDNLDLNIVNNDKSVNISKEKVKHHSKLVVKCLKGCVNIINASWQDMFMLKYKNPT